MFAYSYQVRFKVLQAAAYGSPQGRNRVIFWGAKRGLRLPNFPIPTHAYEGRLCVHNLPTNQEKLPPATRSQTPGSWHLCAPLKATTVNDSIGDLVSCLVEVISDVAELMLWFLCQPPFDWYISHVHCLSRPSMCSLYFIQGKIHTVLSLHQDETKMISRNGCMNSRSPNSTQYYVWERNVRKTKFCLVSMSPWSTLPRHRTVTSYGCEKEMGTLYQATILHDFSPTSSRRAFLPPPPLCGIHTGLCDIDLSLFRWWEMQTIVVCQNIPGMT